MLLSYSFTSIQKGGNGNDIARLVGTDEYGNQYFEELETNYYINRRWVEFAEARRVMSNQGTKIPPPWHGWLAYTYDETPNVYMLVICRKKTLLSLLGDLLDLSG